VTTLSDSGIFYLTRFYRFRTGKEPSHSSGLIASDLGWVKIAVFPGDVGTFWITVGTPVGDDALKDLQDPESFERFLRAFPSIASWRARGLSRPIDGCWAKELAGSTLRGLGLDLRKRRASWIHPSQPALLNPSR
jgi:hypothetical protein